VPPTAASSTESIDDEDEDQARKANGTNGHDTTA